MSTSTPARDQVTELLEAARRGDDGARRELFAELHGQLRKIAVSRLRGERANHTLEPTDLVHEVYLRLSGQELPCRDRAELCGLASNAMRRILIDAVRRRSARKRDGGERVTFDEARLTPPERDTYLVALDGALERLAEVDAELARVIELRVFGGFSVDETAALLEMSTATVKRRFRLAKAWLHRHVTENRR